MSKNYYPQDFLEEYVYTVKEKNINDDREISSDDSDEEISNRESFNEYFNQAVSIDFSLFLSLQ